MDDFPIGHLVGEFAERLAEFPDQSDPVLVKDVREESAGDRRTRRLCRQSGDDGGLLLLGEDGTQQQVSEFAGSREGLGQHLILRRSSQRSKMTCIWTHR